MHFPSALDRKDLARIRKQKYNRDRLRQKRSEYQLELQELQSELVKLSSFLADTRKQQKIGILQWEEVALALKEETTLSLHQNRALKKQVETYTNLCRTMKTWVSHRIIHASINPNLTTWRHTTIASEETSRKLGLDWISKRMYHILPSAIQASGLPSDLTDYYRIDVEMLDDSYRLSEYKQRLEPVSFAVAQRTLSNQYFEIFDGDEEERQDEDFTYIRYPSVYGQTHNVPYTEKMLVRQFKEQDKYVVLTHGVPDDEKYKDPIRCDWSAWVVATRVSSTHTLLQFGYISFGLRNDAGYLPLSKEVLELASYTTDEDLQFKKFCQIQRDDRARRYAEDVIAFRKKCSQTQAAMLEEI
ncbi:hypothetical protein THRCLA_02610 [Thraustotheca clavata]|uniref:Uncharacterized protein n=1 Tax=Thraustotheca clavata TaxID=74557 RepID=A0A1W0A4K6_9STRA|nr:hypothetical protein THRCLA_02610 [Thraustotheca clavata]